LISRILDNKKKFITALLFLIIVSAGLNAILYFAGFFSISADESGRTLLAYEWINEGYSETPTWLPFHTIVMGFGIKIFPDLFWTPRIIGSLFGVSAFISFIWLTHQLFKDRYITLLSSVVALFFPTRVILSAVPLSESMFLFFIFSGIALFIIWLKSEWDHNLFLSVLVISISTSIRYEGWFFSIALISVLIIVKKLKVKNVSIANFFIIGFISFAFPLYWLLFQANISGNPFQFFQDASRGYENAEGITLFTILKNNYLTRFVHHNIIYLCFPGVVASFYLLFRDSAIRKFLILLLIAFIPLTIMSFTGRGVPTHNIWRVTELWNILLIPFTVFFIKNLQLFEFKYLKHLQKIKIPLLIVLILIYYSFHVYRLMGIDAFTKEELKIGRYVEANLIEVDSEKKILIEVPDWSYINIIVASNKPEMFVRNSDFNPKIKGNEILSQDYKINFDELSNRDIKFLLLKSKELKDKVKDNPFFKMKKPFLEWTIFEL